MTCATLTWSLAIGIVIAGGLAVVAHWRALQALDMHRELRHEVELMHERLVVVEARLVSKESIVQGRRP